MKKWIERDLKKLIIDYLEAKRYFFYRQNSGAFQTKSGGFYKFASMTGLPDIVIVKDGQYIGVEIKAGKNKLSPAQFDFGEKLVKAGGKYLIVRSLDDLERELNN